MICFIWILYPIMDNQQHAKHKIFAMSFAKVYPYYITKAERKNRTKEEVDQIICWITGYSLNQLEDHLAKQTNFENFFAQAPQLHPSRHLITWTICWVKIQEIANPLMKEIRYLDKLIDELAKWKPMNIILRW